MRDTDQRPQLSVEDLEPPPEALEPAAPRADGEPPRGVAVIWPPADEG
jgi:hypothetical protein